MELPTLFVLLLVHTTINLSAGQSNSFLFRKDYTYIAEGDGFYKIHTILKTWSEAREMCELEGANLFYAVDEEEAEAVVSFMKRKQPIYNGVFVGITDTISKGVFVTTDGRAINEIYNNWLSGEPNGDNKDCVVLNAEGQLTADRCDKKYPFICKKPLDDIEWNKPCEMPYMDYEYDSKLGKCYKFHLGPKSWTEAYRTCHAELSYLAVINSQAEANHLVNITAKAPKDKIPPGYHLDVWGAVHVGFHNLEGEWKTVHGIALEDSGFGQWPYGEPNGGDKERCGSMYYTGQLNDIGCGVRMFFICEHDIDRFQTLIDDRQGVSNVVRA